MRHFFIFLLILLFILSIVFIYRSKSIGKRTYNIAIIGDSLVDTMQTSFPYLTESLEKKYPNVNFKLYNYGIGGENVEKGLARFDEKLIYKDRNYPPLSQLAPDIIIVASWGYNPFYPPNPEKHKKLLTQIVEEAEKTGAHTYMLEELAPLGEDFAKGVGGVVFSKEEAIKQSERIITLLKNVKSIAQSFNIPVIDIYDKTKMKDSELGQHIYTNQTDGIHPSPFGHRLTADMIVQTIKLVHNQKSKFSTKVSDVFTDFVNTFYYQNSPPQPKPEMTVGMGNMYKSRTIFNNIVNANNLTSISSVFRFTKLDILLSKQEKYTVFVPDNNAFEKLTQNSFITSITSGNETQSTDQFSSYVIPGIYTSSDLKDEMVLKSINGKNIKITRKGNKIIINDKAQIEISDVKSSNGVMHVIDTLL